MGKIQIASTKFFTLLNNSMNRVNFLAIKDYILELIAQFHTKQFNRTGKSQITIVNDPNVQTKKRARLKGIFHYNTFRRPFQIQSNI